MAGITKWYVVHTYSGYENKVQDNIKKVVDNRNMNDQILDVRVMFSSKSLSKQKTTNTSCQTMPGMSSATPAVSPVS